MSQTVTDTEIFEEALEAVFEGRQRQFGDGSRKILREFYDRARLDERKHRVLVPGEVVADFAQLKVGTVFRNDNQKNRGRAYKVTRIVSGTEIEAELVSTRSGRIVETAKSFTSDKFTQNGPFTVTKDPTKK